MLFAGLLIVLLLGFFHESLLGGKVLLYTDNVRSLAPWSAFQPDGFTPRNRDLSDPSLAYYPLLHYARERILHGELPLWNPYLYAGTPLLGNLTAAPFYPVHVVLWLLGMDRGLAWHAALRLFLAGCFVWALTRQLGGGRRGSLLAGLVYPLTGYPLLWLNHALGWVCVCGPPLFYFTERVIGSPSRGAVVGLGVTVAAALLGGHPETALYLFAGAGLYALLRVLSSPIAARARRFGTFVLASLAGAALAAPVLLPCLEYLQRSSALQLRGAGSTQLGYPRPPGGWFSDRGGLLLVALLAAGFIAVLRRLLAVGPPRRAGARRHGGSRWSGGTRWALAALAGILLAALLDVSLGLGLSRRGLLLLDPDLYGGWRPGARPYHGFETYLSVNAGYAGILPLLLAIAGLVLRPGRPALALGGVLLVALAKVVRLPPLYALVKAVPPFDLSADTRALAVVVLAVSVLAGLGWQALESIDRTARARLPALGSLAVAVAVAAGLLAGRAWLVEGALSWELPRAAAAGGGAAAQDPAGSLSLPRPGQRVEGDAVRFEGTVGDEIAQVQVRLAGVPLATVATQPAAHGPGRRFTWIWRCPAVEEGRYTFEVFPGGSRGATALASRTVQVVRRIAPSRRAVLLGVLSLALLAAAAAAARRGLLGGRAAGWIFAAVLAVSLGDLVSFGYGWTPAEDPGDVYPETPAIRFLREHAGQGRIFAEREAFRPNSALVYRLRDVKGYDALDPADYIVYLRSLLSPGAPFYDLSWRDLRLDSPWFDLLGVRWIVTKEPMPEREGLRRVFDGEVQIDENLRARPLVTAVFRSRAFGTLGGRHPFDVLDPREEVLLREPSTHGGVEGRVREVTILAREPERILVRSRLDREGFLVIAENDFPGWEARFRKLDRDGRPAGEWQPAPVLNADYTFRAIPVPAGDLEVECRYRPASLRLGLGVALAGVVLLAGCAWRGGAPSRDGRRGKTREAR